MNKHSWLKDMVLFSVAFLLALNCFAWNGSGTYEDPWQIASDADIASLAAGTQTNSYSGKYFIQTADIFFDEGYTWEMYVIGQLALGDAWYPFSGSYDGDGYEVQGLNINATISQATTNAFGLFGYCENATIENVTVRGSVKVNATYNANACVGVGGVIGISVKGLFASLHNYCDIDVKISNAPTGIRSDIDIKYGVGGVLGLNAWTTNGGTTHIGCENHGNIYVDGVNGACAVGGCFSANIPDSGTSTTFSGWNNYGRVVVSGSDETSMYNHSAASGVGAIHWYIGSGFANRTPKFVGCSNWGNILCSNSVCESGVAVNARGNAVHYTIVSASTNYGEVAFAGGNSNVRTFIGGVSSGVPISENNVANYCVNFGKIKAFGSGTTYPQIGGICSSHNGSFSSSSSYGNKNFGDIEADCPNVSSIVVGGVFSSFRAPRVFTSENHGNIKADTNGSVLLGGVSSMSSQGFNGVNCANCVNFGNIIATGNSNTNYSPCVGGVFASTRLTGTGTRSIVVSNCYNLGRLNLSLNANDCYGGIYGVANSYDNYGVTVKNCYSLIGEGQPLIGAVNAEAAAVSVENCVGIVLGKEGKVAASVTGSNNWSQAGTTIVSYADGYKTPSLCNGNITSGFFTQADKTAAPYDLILPINLALFPTQTDDVKVLHNFTKALGFKRYKRINR